MLTNLSFVGREELFRESRGMRGARAHEHKMLLRTWYCKRTIYHEWRHYRSLVLLRLLCSCLVLLSRGSWYFTHDRFDEFFPKTAIAMCNWATFDTRDAGASSKSSRAPLQKPTLNLDRSRQEMRRYTEYLPLFSDLIVPNGFYTRNYSIFK